MKMFIADFFRLTDEESVRRQLRDGGAVWLGEINVLPFFNMQKEVLPMFCTYAIIYFSEKEIGVEVKT